MTRDTEAERTEQASAGNGAAPTPSTQTPCGEFVWPASLLGFSHEERYAHKVEEK